MCKPLRIKVWVHKSTSPTESFYPSLIDKREHIKLPINELLSSHQFLKTLLYFSWERYIFLLGNEMFWLQRNVAKISRAFRACFCDWKLWQ